MTKKQGTRFELRLGLIHLVTVVGAVMGSLVCSFLLGFFAGQHSGFEGALAANIANQAKLPISPTEVRRNEVERAMSAEVLEKLSGDTTVSLDDAELPTMGAVTEMHRDDLVALNDSLQETVENPTGTVAGNGKENRRAESLNMDSVFAESNVEPALGSQLGAIDSPIEVVRDSATVKKKRGVATLADAITEPEVKSKSPIIRSETDVGSTRAEPPRIAKAETTPVKPDPTRAKLAMSEVKQAPAKEKTPAAREESGFVRSSIPKGWFAQVAAPRKLKDADVLAQRLRGSGFPVVIETATVRGQDYFRVLVGPEENRRQGQVLVDQLRRESYIPAEPFLRLVR